ncbi:SDR family NAD(P)-dependent oxidoreductase [Paractinoplanes abujensis]|uniref:NAD(P)-dependent dehydrogenase (Short-subunit alcohol dehydrogenase family) n=1 Tax=Paractinoplanes abujensis TaxID=882441 RepID=A0A7W7CUE1_9ACTN|nr:SDR family NAD(P)-dependent oxidoreductase [Actinoplanes abujensis]MBB4694874.1 NAD(P)-dependent dehydrogenase (short-subunit alcohol dehydrogenase family) [Actinoplanes abujensis]
MENGRTALITGGTGGLGVAVVEAFVADGWRVVAPVRAGSVDKLPKGAVPLVADLTDETDVTTAVSAAVTAGAPDHPLRAVINLVGGFASGPLIAEAPYAGLTAQLDQNLRPTYLVTQAALPHLVDAGGGSIVCVSSRTALSPFPGGSAYAIAKAAVLAFADSVAVEYKSRNVRCNTVLPSVIDTAVNRAAMPDADVAKWVRPDEIAPTILFLASDASAPTSGAQIPVYGRA